MSLCLLSGRVPASVKTRPRLALDGEPRDVRPTTFLDRPDSFATGGLGNVGGSIRSEAMQDARARARRPLSDRIEVAAPSLVALVTRAVGRLPAPLRRRVLTAAFARAEAAFNRGDFEAIFALFADDVRYVPPPALSDAAIDGRAAVLAFWQRVGLRFRASTIENLSVQEATPRRFVRTARITHRTDREELSYVIRQVTELRGGRVVSQVNQRIG